MFQHNQPMNWKGSATSVKGKTSPTTESVKNRELLNINFNLNLISFTVNIPLLMNEFGQNRYTPMFKFRIWLLLYSITCDWSCNSIRVHPIHPPPLFYLYICISPSSIYIYVYPPFRFIYIYFEIEIACSIIFKFLYLNSFKQ